MFKFFTRKKATTREFDVLDWSVFAGAEAWDENTPPLIRELDNLTVIGDKEQVQLVAHETETGEQPPCYMLNVAFPTQYVARLFLEALPQTLTGEQANANGFIRIL